MQRYRIILLWAVVSFLPPAFAGVPFYEPSDQEEKTADYGAYPSNYKELVMAYMKRKFPASSTAHYLFVEKPRKNTNLAKRREDVVWGYWVQVEIDIDGSNNSYTWWGFFIRDGKIIRTNHSQPRDRPRLFEPIKAVPAKSTNFQITYSVNEDGDGVGEQFPPSILYSTKGSADYVTSMSVTDLSLCKRPAEKAICRAFVEMISGKPRAFDMDVSDTRISGDDYTTTFLAAVPGIIYEGVDNLVGFLGVDTAAPPYGRVVLYIYARKGNNLLQLAAPVGTCMGREYEEESQALFHRRNCNPDKAMLRKGSETAKSLVSLFSLMNKQ